MGFAYFPRNLLPRIMEYRVRLPNKRRIEKIVAKHGGLMPKYIRIYALREMKSVISDNDTFRFISSKFGELTISARHYMNLLLEADIIYPTYIHHIKRVLNDAIVV